MTEKELHTFIQLGEGPELEFKQGMPAELGETSRDGVAFIASMLMA